MEAPVVEGPPAPIGAAEIDTTAEHASITGARAGCVAIGATPEEVTVACDAVRDTAIVLEGMSQPALAVRVEGAATLAEIVNGRVWRITLLEPGPETADGLSVGAPASRLAAYDDARVQAGEGRYFVTAPELCGLSFGLEGLPFGGSPPTAADLASAPATIRVERILVLGGC